MGLMKTTLPGLLLDRAADSGETIILRRKDHGVWKSVSWSELARSAREIGAALSAVGVGRGSKVAVLSQTRPEWVYADLAVMGLGAVCVGLPISANADQIAQSLRDFDCEIVFAENEEQLDKLLGIQGECPALCHIVMFDMNGLHDVDNPMVTSLATFTARGLDSAATAWEEIAQSIDPDSTAAVVFTAGTTGPAKAVCLSHQRIMTQAVNGAAMLGLVEGDERLAFLPMSHVFERVVGLYQSLIVGAISNYVESQETVSDNLREIQPTVVGLVPRMWRRMRAAIVQAADEATVIQGWVYRWALAVGSAYAARTAPGLALRLQHQLADFLVLSQLRKRMGLARARAVFSAMAPMPEDLLQWYRSLGVDMRVAYAITEGGGLVSLLPSTSGDACEIKISRDGEILLPEAQVVNGDLNERPLLKDGWFGTGDIGFVDGLGVRILGRCADTLRVADGSAVSAPLIETALCISPFVADAVVSRDDDGRLSCTLLIDHDAMERWAQTEDIAFTSFSTLMRTQKARDHIRREVAAVNSRLPAAQRVVTVRVIERRVQPGDAELTTIMTLRRTLDQAAIGGELVMC